MTKQEEVRGQKFLRGSRAVADPGIEFGRGTWRARGARAYNGGLGAEPPVESRAPGLGVRGTKPPEAESL